MRNTAKPWMSTYSLDVPAVAMSNTIGTRRVTFWPSELVPVARMVSGYSPAGSDPPLRVTVTVCVVPLLRVNVLGDTETAPMPDGRTPRSAGAPSIDRVTGPAKAVALLFGVENVIVPDTVVLVVAAEIT